ncbi:LamG-like jellyroll fold domain-containing protein [Haloferula sp.]|uniref:LamG-like jellyroll fold domain-containing protein n=1 Tax=Haloferula sp. TaxID=2497595 RepID=UPI00329AA3EA
MSNNHRAPLILCLGCLVVACLVYFLRDDSAQRLTGTESPGSAESVKADSDQNKSEHAAAAGEESRRPEKATDAEHHSTAVSQLRRGTNNRLLLEEAVTTERHADPASLSKEFIFRPVGHEINGPLTIDEHTSSAIETSVDFAALKAFLDSNDGSIRIPISRDKEVLATFDKVVTRGAHTTTLIGQVVDDSFSDILIVFHDGAVAGSLSFHDTNTHYQFAMAGNGDVAVRHLDPHSFDAGCGECDNPKHQFAEGSPDADNEGADPEGEILEAPAGKTPFDVVIGYSAEARISDGGTAAIEARIIASVDNMNLALSNSQSGDWFCSLMAMIEDPDTSFSDSNYDTMGQILTDLNQTADGVIDTLTDLRQELGADQATFVCNAGIAGTGGIAYRPGRYAVCGRNQMFSPNLVFAHEIGHNLGLRHAWGDSGTSGTNPKNQSNYGWRFDPPNGGKVRTIMSYSAGWGGSRIKYFANPSVSYNGAPTGVVRGFNATDNSSSPAYDQKFVTDGDIGGLGSGFDGSNSDLGARNGDYLIYNSGTLANRDVREPLAVLEPTASTMLETGSSTTIYWHGGDHTDTVEIDLYKSGAFQSTIASGISGEARWYDWIVPTLTAGNDYSIRVTLSGSTSDDSGAFTIGTPIGVLPYAESFETDLGIWLQPQDDDLDWTRHTGGTETGNTGPDGASYGSQYMYVENHDSGTQYKTATFQGTFDFSRTRQPELSFDFHMYGFYIDFLAVDVHDGSAWVNDVWIRSGQQHNSSTAAWTEATVDLSSYADNDSVTIRFRSKQKQWHAADTAIDNIQIKDLPVGPLVAHWSMEDNAGQDVTDDTGNDLDATMSGASWVPGVDGNSLDFDGTSSTVTLPASAFYSISDEVTVSMWVYGDGDQPRQDSLFYAVNDSGERVLNVHLPWSDGTVYWDAGFSGTYDRINKSASPDQFKGQWNHWAFTKNASNGDMAIYLNGSLWHSGTNKTRSMAGITAAVLGSQISDRNYSGIIDDVRLYNISLDASEVSELFLDYTTPSGVSLGWLMSYGIDPSEEGAQANNDGDRQTNELEWIFGTDPLVSDSPIKELSSSEGVMTFKYTRRKQDASDVYAEWSSDLSAVTWPTSGLSEQVTDDDGEIETVTVTISTDLNQKFVRIRVD